MKLEHMIEAAMTFTLAEILEEESGFSTEQAVALAADKVKKTDYSVILKRVDEQLEDLKQAYPGVTRTEAALMYFMMRDMRDIFTVNVTEERVH